MGRTRRAFTLIELLVVIGIVVLLISIILPAVMKTRHTGGRIKCSSNLRQIGQAIQMYANENKGEFPRAVADGTGAGPTEYTAALAPNPFLPGGPGPNDVTAALFLLARTQDITTDVFICPSVAGAEPWDFGGGGRVSTAVSNFPGRQFLTYSFANPYATPEAEKGGYKLSYALTSDFAIAADMNGGGAGVTSVDPRSSRSAMAAANSPNHAGDGQNVLFADGHVEFQNTPFCGMLRTPGGVTNQFRDNIYTHGAGWGAATGVRGSPADALDSILLPTFLDGPAPSPDASPATRASMPWLWGGMAGAFVTIVLALTLRSRRRTAQPAMPA